MMYRLIQSKRNQTKRRKSPIELRWTGTNGQWSMVIASDLKRQYNKQESNHWQKFWNIVWTNSFIFLYYLLSSNSSDGRRIFIFSTDRCLLYDRFWEKLLVRKFTHLKLIKFTKHTKLRCWYEKNLRYIYSKVWEVRHPSD